VTGVQTCAFRSIQDTPQTFDLSENGGIVSWVRQSKEPLLVRDFQREMDRLPAKPRYISPDPPRSAIFIPLISGEEVMGIMAAQSSQPDKFDEEDVRLLLILANQAAAAIAHAQLFERERTRAAHLALVGEIGRQISRVQSRAEIYSQVVTLTKETFHFHLVNIYEVVEETGEIVMQDSSSPDFLAQGMRLQPGQGLVGTAVATRQTILSNDTENDDRFIRQPNELEAYTRAEMAIPLIMDDEVLGALDVQSPQPGRFSEVDQTTLEALAAETAVVISKARQLARQREQAWLSTAQLQVAEAIGLSRNMEEMLTAVTRLTPMLVGAQFCLIFLWDEERQEYGEATVYGLPAQYAEALADARLSIGDWHALDAVHVGQEMLPTQQIPDWLAPALPEVWPPVQELRLAPLLSAAKTLGVMVVGDFLGSDHSDHSRQRREELLRNIAQQTSTALENAALRLAQQEEAWVNTALFQVAAAVNRLINLDEILDTITRLIPLLVGVESAVILIWDAEKELFHAGPSYGLNEMQRGLLETLELSREEFQALTDATLEDLRPTGDYYGIYLPDWLGKVMGTSAAYLFPLQARGNLVGALLAGIEPENGRGLSSRRLNILTGVAHQAATAVVNHQLYQEAAERSRLEQELGVAREIQASLIPSGSPDIPGCDVASYWQAARQVSGDFYDFLALDDGRWGIIIADVSDKGVPAALFMALSRTILRTIGFNRRDPASTLMRTNHLISLDAQNDMFVTVFYAIYEPQTGKLTYANAGHNPPLLLRATGEATLLTTNGMALGILPEVEIGNQTLDFLPGDTLVLYTDGVTEAVNEDFDEFGLRRLSMIAREHQSESAAAVVTAVTDAIRNHAGETPQFDDITLIVMKRGDEEMRE
jgi:serine phosphatase RsbU (regulator of sigma subunit)/putative methionine-R-sulfoxide reductase with GAF domain